MGVDLAFPLDWSVLSGTATAQVTTDAAQGFTLTNDVLLGVAGKGAAFFALSGTGNTGSAVAATLNVNAYAFTTGVLSRLGASAVFLPVTVASGAAPRVAWQPKSTLFAAPGHVPYGQVVITATPTQTGSATLSLTWAIFQANQP